MPKMKPGPKSYHERQLQRAFDLGESSESDVDVDFQSPENDDVTDYGLNFTSSRITHANPQRCSTLANASELQTLSPRQAHARLRSSPQTPRSTQETQRTPAKSSGRPQSQKNTRKSTRKTRQSMARHDECSPSSSPLVQTRALQTLNEDRNESRKSTRNVVQSQDQENRPPQRAQQPSSTGNAGDRGKPTGSQRRKRKTPQGLLQQFIREVMRLQASTDFMIPRSPFGKLVRELMEKHSRFVTHISRDALEALQTATEMYTTQRLQDAYLLTLHRNRVTITVEDLRLLATLRWPSD